MWVVQALNSTDRRLCPLFSNFGISEFHGLIEVYAFTMSSWQIAVEHAVWDSRTVHDVRCVDIQPKVNTRMWNGLEEDVSIGYRFGGNWSFRARRRTRQRDDGRCSWDCQVATKWNQMFEENWGRGRRFVAWFYSRKSGAILFLHVCITYWVILWPLRKPVRKQVYCGCSGCFYFIPTAVETSSSLWRFPFASTVTLLFLFIRFVQHNCSACVLTNRKMSFYCWCTVRTTVECSAQRTSFPEENQAVLIRIKFWVSNLQVQQRRCMIKLLFFL